MSAYRFCRTDDIGLLVDALNRCWAPHFPGDPPMTASAFKRSIRDLQVWCSSCMVAFSGSDPIGVLIGSKRASGTLVHKIAVHPEHLRQGHGRHLLASLASKLAILGPPRITAEVPETLAPACGLLAACGYVHDAVLTDYVLDWGQTGVKRGSDEGQTGVRRLIVPTTVDDLAANDLLDPANPLGCWERSVETLSARKNEIAGLALASEDRIEAYILQVRNGTEAEIMALRSFNGGSDANLKHLLAGLHAQGLEILRFPKVHPAEFSPACLVTLGFHPAGAHRLYVTRARSG